MIWIWIAFLVLFLAMLALDLGAFHRHPRAVGLKEALIWSGVWIGAALAFSVLVYFAYESHWLGLGQAADSVDQVVNDGQSATEKFLTCFLLEKSLSIDNLFVIAAVFASLRIPDSLQHRVLFWGILGAVVLRAIMIGLGTELVQHFHWVLYIFGGLLLLAALKMLLPERQGSDPAHSWPLRTARRILPMTPELHGSQFLARISGKWKFTPLALALAVVESSDVIFAVDSVPAALGVTSDPFLVFSSNMFAMMSLRCLYFALAGLVMIFKYLKLSVAGILALIGGKLVAGNWLVDTIGQSLNLWMLAAVAGILAIGMIASWIARRRESPATAAALNPSNQKRAPETA